MLKRSDENASKAPLLTDPWKRWITGTLDKSFKISPWSAFKFHKFMLAIGLNPRLDGLGQDCTYSEGPY